MKKLHQNVFYYYRGSHTTVADIEAQLENNTTKALINVLENCSSTIRRSLVDAIVGASVVGQKVTGINFTIQESNIGAELVRSIPAKWVIGISPDGKIWKSGKERTERNLPDAWIWSKDFVILLENKTHGRLFSSQIDRYRRILGNCRLVARSWTNDIYPIFARVANQPGLSEKDRFLIEEFRRYLEIIKFSQFEGFELQDFARLLSKDKDEKDYTLHKFRLLADLLKEPMKQRGLNRYNDGGDWHGFYRRLGKHKCRELAHFSIFEEDAVGFKLHVGRGPDRENLERKVDSKQFQDLLLDLGQKSKQSGRDYQVTVAQTELVRPYKNDWAVQFTVYSSWMTTERIKQLVDIIKSSRNYWFNLYYEIEPHEAEKLGKKIINQIISATHDFWDMYRFLICP